MGKFSEIKVTEKGNLLLADVQAGGEFDATRLVLGSGYIPAGKTAKTMTDVAAPEMSLDINSVEKTGDGMVIFGGRYSNESQEEDFYFREFALYARAIYRDEAGAIVSTGNEVLYAYANAGNDADLLPAYTSGTPLERQLEMASYVGSETEVNATLASGVYLPRADFDSHASRHAKNGADPITPGSIGAAPAEYISGVYIIEQYESLDVLLETIYSTMADKTAKMVLITDNSSSTWGGGTCLVIITRNTIQYGTADFFGYTHHGIVLRKSKRTEWEPLEWENPPMGTNVEYRTTERILGKVVYKRLVNGIIQYRLEDETEWKNYAKAVGAVSKSGDTVNGDLNVNGAFAVERTDSNRKARTVAHNNADKEVDFQNYGDDANYVSVRVATEAKGIGDAVKVTQMKDGQFSSFTLLHTGNKEKIFTFGAEELEPGVSPLGTGQLHFTYE